MTRTIRVRIMQRVVPPYRVPIFEALARSPDIDLELWASFGTALGSIDSVAGSSAFRCVESPTRAFGPFRWQPRAIEAATTGSCDVLVLSWDSRDVLLPRVLRAARRSGCATLLWGHGFGKTIPALGGWLRDRLVDRADGLLFYGPTVRDRYAAKGVPAERLFVAPNAIDQAPIRSARARWLARPDALAEFRRKEGLGTGPVILFLSRLEPDKRPDLLLSAAPRILARVPDARFAFIGKGSAKADLERQAASLGIAGAVRFAGAIYDDDALAPWCLSSRLLVHPGGIGLTLFHAFGFGMPVVTTDRMILHGPEIEMFQAERNGLLYRHGDEERLASAALRLLEDEPLRARLAENALATVGPGSGRDLEGMVAGFRDAVIAVAARRGDPAALVGERSL